MKTNDTNDVDELIEDFPWLVGWDLDQWDFSNKDAALFYQYLEKNQVSKAINLLVNNDYFEKEDALKVVEYFKQNIGNYTKNIKKNYQLIEISYHDFEKKYPLNIENNISVKAVVNYKGKIRDVKVFRSACYMGEKIIKEDKDWMIWIDWRDRIRIPLKEVSQIWLFEEM